jgi:hypothetical protein
VLQAAAAGQEVVGDGEDVIALGIGQVPLEQVDVLVTESSPAKGTILLSAS